MKKEYIYLAAFLTIFSIVLYKGGCNHKNKSLKPTKKYFNTDTLKTLESRWKSKYDSLVKEKNKAMSEVVTITKQETIKRYKETPKVVWVNDTVLTSFDTCRQSLVYYTTELTQTKNLLNGCKQISKEKTKVIETIEHALTLCKSDLAKKAKSDKRKTLISKLSRWGERTLWAIAILIKK